MSFRVDGVSRIQCWEWAKKTVPAAEKLGGGNARLLTEPEWLARVEAAAANRFATARPGPLKSFATPMAMEQFVAMCSPDDVRGLRMMELYGTGQRDRATGDAITRWREYRGIARAA